MIEQQLALAPRHLGAVDERRQVVGIAERAGRRGGAHRVQIPVQQAYVAADELPQTTDKPLHVGIVQQKLCERVVNVVAKLQLYDVLVELQREHPVRHPGQIRVGRQLEHRQSQLVGLLKDMRGDLFDIASRLDAHPRHAALVQARDEIPHARIVVGDGEQRGQKQRAVLQIGKDIRNLHERRSGDRAGKALEARHRLGPLKAVQIEYIPDCFEHKITLRPRVFHPCRQRAPSIVPCRQGCQGDKYSKDFYCLSTMTKPPCCDKGSQSTPPPPTDHANEPTHLSLRLRVVSQASAIPPVRAIPRSFASG